MPEDAHTDACCTRGVNVVFLGTRKAVCTGEEVPSFNGRAERPKGQQQHPGGEQSPPADNPRKHSSLQLHLT